VHEGDVVGKEGVVRCRVRAKIRSKKQDLVPIDDDTNIAARGIRSMSRDGDKRLVDRADNKQIKRFHSKCWNARAHVTAAINEICGKNV
jgi:hypothetical protein